MPISTTVTVGNAETHHIAVNGDAKSIRWPAGHTLFFDPPWDDALSLEVPADAYSSVVAFCDGQRASDIIGLFGPPDWVFVWDCITSWVVPGRPLKRGKFCMAYFDRWLTNEAVFLQRKNGPRVAFNSRGQYMAGDPRGVRLTDVFQHPITRLHGVAGAHRHSKPVEWLAYLIAGTTPRGETVVDPFAGSFAAAAAAAAVGVNSWSCEINPFDAGHFASAVGRGLGHAHPDAGQLCIGLE